MNNEQLIELIVNQVLEKLKTPLTKKVLLVSDEKNTSSNVVNYQDYQSDVRYDEYLIDYLTLKECACLVHGIRENSKIEFILNNKNKNFKIKKIENGNNNLVNIYQEELIKLGYLFDDVEDVVIFEDNDDVVIRIKKKVINERDLINEQVKKNNCLIVSKKAIITPLANDYLKNNSIKIKRED